MTLTSRKDFLSTLSPPECPICCEHVNAPITFTCEHTFCLECAKTWLKTSATCPSCHTVLYDDELDDDEPEDDSEAEVPADPEYVAERFASTAAVELPESTLDSNTSTPETVTVPPRRLLSRLLPRLHRHVEHREAALEQRRLALRQWQTSLYKLFRSLKQIHHNLEARRRAYDRQRTSLFEAADWLGRQIELQNTFYAAVVSQVKEERAQRLREREMVAEQHVQEPEDGVTEEPGLSANAENASNKGGKWSWARVKSELRGKYLPS